MSTASSYVNQKPSQRRLIGLAVAVLAHVVLIYALINGLGRQVLEVIKQPLDIKIIEEVKLPPPPPPPPPPKNLPPPPPTAPPPPAFVPPPEVKVETPPAPAITAVTQEEPKPAPIVIQKPVEVKAPPAPPAPPPPPPPKPRLRTGVQPTYRPPVAELLSAYPRQARREGITGKVLLRLTVSPAGDVINVVVRDAQPKRVFDKVATEYVSRFKFEKGEDEFEVDQEIEFRLE